MKGIKGIHFYDIVPTTHLLERLSADSDKPDVCAALVELLQNSFYPTSNSNSAMNSSNQIQRCIAFVKENEWAAMAFYKYLHTHVSVGSVVKFCAMLFQILNNESNEAPVAKSKRERNAVNKSHIK